jgi:hypothetical protein
VVNLVLDKDFEGLKGNLEYGNGTEIAHNKVAAELAWGTRFAEGRGHFILSGNYTASPDAVLIGQTGWWQGSTLVQNPAYTIGGSQPLFIHKDHVGNIQVTQGGLIAANTQAAWAQRFPPMRWWACSSAPMARCRPSIRAPSTRPAATMAAAPMNVRAPSVMPCWPCLTAMPHSSAMPAMI